MFQQTFFQKQWHYFSPPKIGNIVVPHARTLEPATTVGDPRGPGEVVTGPRMFGVTWGAGGPALPRVHTVQGEHGHTRVRPRPAPGTRHPLGGDHRADVTGGHIL